MARDMWHAKYVGTNTLYAGCYAVLMKTCNAEWVKVQFDTCKAYEELCYNWHLWLAKDWKIEEYEDE